MYCNQIAMAVRGGIELYNIHPWLAASVLVVLALVVFGSLFLWLVRGRVASWTTDLRRLVSSAIVRAARRDAAAVGMADFVASLGLSSPPAAASEIVHPAAW